MGRYFPLFVDLEGKKVVVVGAGTIAGRRIRTLLDFGARITVIAPEAVDQIRTLAAEKELVWRREAWSGAAEELLPGSAFVLTAVDDSAVNEAVWRACKARGIPVNRADDRSRCDFYFPGIATCGNTVIGVSTNGREKRRQQALAKQIEQVLWQETKPEETSVSE